MEHHTFGLGIIYLEAVLHTIFVQRVYGLLEFFGRVGNDRKIVGKHKIFDQSFIDFQASVREAAREVVDK